MIELNQEYWTKRYNDQETGWDVGEVSAPLKEYIDQLANKELKILIPGAGNAYEAEYLYKQGFKNVFVIDISQEPLKNILKRSPDFPAEQLIHGDFFEHTNTYDLIIEQTFFCAIDPSLRANYAKKMAALLNKGGKLAGVLFDDPLNTAHPPFGGNKAEYLTYFEPYFSFKTFDPCYNSIKPRAGRELFIILEKK
ncbi:MAG: TPMT family class I SAM-dependent methyltransferase [Bacteroidia bacterium]|nr:TPMT family class I SAM-dependent methyltransferase [Bacteroidia bacterium]